MILQLRCKSLFTFVGKSNADAINKPGNASISQTKTHLDFPTNMQVYFSCRERVKKKERIQGLIESEESRKANPSVSTLEPHRKCCCHCQRESLQHLTGIGMERETGMPVLYHFSIF